MSPRYRTAGRVGLLVIGLLAAAGVAYAVELSPAVSVNGEWSLSQVALGGGLLALLGIGIVISRSRTKDLETVEETLVDLGLFLRAQNLNRFAEGLEHFASYDPEGAWAYVEPVWRRKRAFLRDDVRKSIANLEASLGQVEGS